MRKVYEKLSPVCGVVVVYQLITIILVIIFDQPYFKTPGFLVSRFIILIYLVFRIINNSDFLKQYGILADCLLIYMSLAFFYGETGLFNTFLFDKIDPLLSFYDEFLFGFQPSLLFSEILNHTFFSELFFLGYFSYYIMPLAALLIIWFYKKEFFEQFSFIVLSAYFVYYLIFIILPAVGPQYYFPSPLNQIEAKGPFASMVKLIQASGEAPTAAFPSSHVGIMVIILSLLYHEKKALFKIFLPFSITLFFSTIYIKAHYFVDVVAGLISGPVILFLNKFTYFKFNILRNK